MKQMINLFFLILLNGIAVGQKIFKMDKSSAKYSAVLSVDTCDNWFCSGNGKVKIFDKKTKKLKQTFLSENLFIELDQKTKKPTEKMLKLYDGQSAIFFDDYNFDGKEDIAIRNGNNSGYRGPSYDVYLFSIKKSKFILNKQLTNLVSDNLGMFVTNHKTKRLIAFSKSGPAWHIRKEYSVLPKIGLKKIFELVEDETIGSEGFIYVTTRELIKNRWKTRTKKYKAKEYYKK